MLTSLVGPDIRLHNSKLNTKAPGGGAAVEWHQDWAFYPHTNDDMLAVGVILSDIEIDNGPFLVIPGSHKGPTLSHMSNGVFGGAIDPDDPAFDVSKAVALTGKAGSMSVHHVAPCTVLRPICQTAPACCCCMNVVPPMPGRSGAAPAHSPV